MNELDTLTLQEAADYLKCGKSTLLTLLRNPDPAIKPPGAKIGKSWVFVRVHLVEYILNRSCSGGLSQIAPTSTKKKKKKSYQSIKEKDQKFGISSLTSTEDEYIKALGLSLPIQKE